jgi:steroid delta-isomerase
MATTEEIRNACETYIAAVAAGDYETVASLYADDATVEDPVGSDPHVGIDAIHAFYKSVAGEGMTSEMIGKVQVVGSTAAFHFEIGPDGNPLVEPIDVMTFDDAGKITSMKAYWSFD